MASVTLAGDGRETMKAPEMESTRRISRGAAPYSDYIPLRSGSMKRHVRRPVAKR